MSLTLKETVALEVMMKLLPLETHLTPTELVRKSFVYAEEFAKVASPLRDPSTKPLPPTPPDPHRIGAPPRGFKK